MKEFRLISLRLTDTDEYDEGEYMFSSDIVKSRKVPYTTLLIGANGTGKSRLLKIIIDIFNDLYCFVRNQEYTFRFKQYYLVRYSINGAIHTVENLKQNLEFRKNDQLINKITYSLLPNKGLVAAYSMYEKFTPKSITKKNSGNKKTTRYDNDFYEYLGVKSERNFSFSGSYINKSIDLITAAMGDDGFNKDLSHVFYLLKFDPVMLIKYKVNKNRQLFSGDMTAESLKTYVTSIHYRSTGFSYSALDRLAQMPDAFLEEMSESLNYISKSFGPDLQLPVELVFEENSKNPLFNRNYKHISLLREFNLISYEEVLVYKKSSKSNHKYQIALREMSSGEIQLLTSMLALVAIVKENSIILIDEPEISLHPNWQIQYVDILNKVFRNCTNCHFIIASHSHFLVSNLREESSSILSLKKVKSAILSDFIDFDTFGWSAENILYNVFQVPTVRNFYFEMDVRNLLKLLSSSKKGNNGKIQKYLTKFQNYSIHPNDPLNLVIKSAQKYLDESK